MSSSSSSPSFSVLSLSTLSLSFSLASFPTDDVLVSRLVRERCAADSNDDNDGACLAALLGLRRPGTVALECDDNAFVVAVFEMRSALGFIFLWTTLIGSWLESLLLLLSSLESEGMSMAAVAAEPSRCRFIMGVMWWWLIFVEAKPHTHAPKNRNCHHVLIHR